MTEITRYEYVICFESIGETSLRHVKNTASCATPLTWSVTSFTQYCDPVAEFLPRDIHFPVPWSQRYLGIYEAGSTRIWLCGSS